MKINSGIKIKIYKMISRKKTIKVENYNRINQFKNKYLRISQVDQT